MKFIKVLKWSLLTVLIIGLGFGIHYCYVSFPIISGYTAKFMASEVFVSGRQQEQVQKEELSSFPFSLASSTVDFKDSSVTVSVFGFARRKAIYRSGLGCTLLNEYTEDAVRRQSFVLAKPTVMNRDTILWPMGDKLKDSLPATIDKSKLDSAMEDFFSEPDSKHLKNTRAVVIVYDGELVAERYAPGYSKDQKLIGWSMAKSVTGALIGILANKGLINPDATPPIKGWEVNDPRHSIRTKDLLQQVSGLKFEENYTKVSDATKMLYEKADMGGYAASNPLDTIPGTRFSYSSGNSNILSRAVRNITGEDAYHAFPYTALFYKLGMYHTVWEPDESGTFVGSSYIYASARDWARFGLLYLNKGNYQGEQILPESWVTQSGTPGPAGNYNHYGFQFWLNTGNNGVPEEAFPHVTAPMFYADGYEGQDVYIIPSKNLVVVRLGMTAGGRYNADQSLGLVLGAFK